MIDGGLPWPVKSPSYTTGVCEVISGEVMVIGAG